MKLEGSRTILSTPKKVWDALLSEEVLRGCIPGCEELNRTTEDQFDAKVSIKVGPVRARFAGTVALRDLEQPRSCRIEGEGNGGIAGFARGSATITLSETKAGTELVYIADIKIGGKIASLGDRMFRGVAERNVTSFFDAFEAIMNSENKVEQT